MKTLKERREEAIEQTTTTGDVLDSGITYTKFDNIHKELQISSTDIGSQVWIAGEGYNDEVYLKSIKEDIGEAEVIRRGSRAIRTYFIDEIALNPAELEKTNEQIEYEKAVKEAKKQKYENPLTGRKCSYGYSVRKGFITETGEKIPKKDMKFENPETGRMVSYSYAKQQGII